MSIVAWLHKDKQSAFVITEKVKQIWEGCNPKNVENYTIPLVLESELSALRQELEEAKEALSPKPPREGIYPWAVELEPTARNAQFWIEGGRNEPDKGKAVMCVEQGVNSWKNACYSYAEKNYDLTAELSACRKELEEAGEPVGYFQDCDLKQLARLDNRTFAMQVVAGRTKHIGMSPLYSTPPIREGWVMVQSSRIENMEDFIHDIANEVYPYPEQAVRKASELLSAVKKD